MKRILISSLLIFPNFLIGHCYTVITTIEAPGVQRSTAKFDYVGIETFDALSPGLHDSYVSDFGGNATGIVGEYKNLEVRLRDVYGGAHGMGNYAGAARFATYSIDLRQYGANGVNYFGFWVSALDPGNQLELYDGDTLIAKMSPTDILELAQQDHHYLGNPTYDPKANPNECYVFINMFCGDCFISRVLFHQSTTAAYESDNHSVGYYTDTSGREVTSTTTSTITTTTTTSTTTATMTTSTTATTMATSTTATTMTTSTTTKTMTTSTTTTAIITEATSWILTTTMFTMSMTTSTIMTFTDATTGFALPGRAWVTIASASALLIGGAGTASMMRQFTAEPAQLAGSFEGEETQETLRDREIFVTPEVADMA